MILPAVTTPEWTFFLGSVIASFSPAATITARYSLKVEKSSLLCYWRSSLVLKVLLYMQKLKKSVLKDRLLLNAWTRRRLDESTLSSALSAPSGWQNSIIPNFSLPIVGTIQLSLNPINFCFSSSLGTSMFSGLYNLTLDTFPGTFLLVNAGLFLLTIPNSIFHTWLLPRVSQ